ncbi:acyl-CoA dehydrogenase family protein, partial [Tsukamurella strandjordii]|uniref:acyl-CoA dehydrogenase family protein n=2 Tax=Tsukamurella TaxID=2060 RepID=UPI0039F13913
MDFHPDENQAAVAGLAADVLARSTEQDDWRATWTDLARADLLGLPAPESAGGAGLGAEEVAAVLTEAGRLHSTAPLLPALALGIAPVAAYGTEEQQQRLLPAALRGEQLVVGALNEAGAALPRRPR